MKLMTSLFILLIATSCVEKPECLPPSESSLKQVEKVQFGNKQVFVKKMDDKYFIEDDVVLSELNSSYRLDFYNIRPWKNNIVYYKINSKLPLKSRVYRAIDIWNKQLNGFVQFKEITDSVEDYVEIIPSKGCWSYVGMRGGRQEMGLDLSCLSGTIAHEFGHVMGLDHEHVRTDRDEFISVDWCNVQEEAKTNFIKNGLDEVKLGRYDYKSIMHYGQFSFSKNVLPVLTSLTDTPVPLVSPKKPTVNDILRIKCIHSHLNSCEELEKQ